MSLIAYFLWASGTILLQVIIIFLFAIPTGMGLGIGLHFGKNIIGRFFGNSKPMDPKGELDKMEEELLVASSGAEK